MDLNLCLNDTKVARNAYKNVKQNELNPHLPISRCVSVKDRIKTSQQVFTVGLICLLLRNGNTKLS